MTSKKENNRIPNFKSIAAEAHFWDTHDTTDFEREFTPIEVKFAQNLSEALNVRFESEDVAKIRQQASKKGIGPTTLVRMWVKEHLAA